MYAYWHFLFYDTSSSTEEKLTWVIHVGSATVLFISFGICAACYLYFVYPESVLLGPKNDRF